MNSSGVSIVSREQHAAPLHRYLVCIKRRGSKMEDGNSPFPILDSYLGAQFARLFFIQREVAVNGIDHDAIHFARLRCRDVAVAHVVEDTLGIARQRIAPDATPGSFPAKPLGRVDDM